MMYKLIWLVILSLYRFCVQVKTLWLFAKRKISKHFLWSNVGDEMEYVKKSLISCYKIPNHIAVIIGNDTLRYKDLASIILWCFAANISYVSFYDYEGKIKRNELLLLNSLLSKSNGYLKPEDLIWDRDSLNKKLQKNGFSNGHANGYTEHPKIHVNIFDYSDCTRCLVDVVKHFRQNDFKSSDITLRKVDEIMRDLTGIPDPEMAICFGPVLSTYGFMPWHIAITEILSLETHHDVTVEEFVSLIHMYNKCEQRFGL